jgi:hypothetical protein
MWVGGFFVFCSCSLSTITVVGRRIWDPCNPTLGSLDRSAGF